MIAKLIATTCLVSVASAAILSRNDNELDLKEQSTFFVNHLQSYMVEVDDEETCKYYGRSSYIKKTLQEENSKSVRYIDTEEMKRLIDECRSKKASPNSMRGSFLFLEDGVLIFPGTKWCGDGDSAENYEDLGVYEKTDMCCREHDHCPDYIEGEQTKHGLTNNGSFTKSHCDCDDALRQCFHAADESISDPVGFVFFDLLGTSCFREDYPIVSCLEYGGPTRSSCQKYELDETKPKIWQFFDGKVYGE